MADLRRRLPGVDRLVVQVDEPALPGVLAGRVPTASGFGRHRAVHPPEASAALAGLVEAIVDGGAEPWVHSCADGTPLALLRGAGATGLAVDLARVGAADHEQLAEALDAGETVVLGVVPTATPAGGGGSRRAGACGGSRWSASSRDRACSSVPPAGSPAPTRPGRGRR